MNEKEIEEAFLADLKLLLAKYKAELSAEDFYPGYPECGEDVRMTVYIPAYYIENELYRQSVSIDLGRMFKP